MIKPCLKQLFLLLCALTYSFISSQQTQSFHYQFDILNEFTFNLDELAQTTFLYNPKLQNCGTCHIQFPSLLDYEHVPFLEPYPATSNRKPFLYQDKFFLFELTPGRVDALIIYCELAGSKSNPKLPPLYYTPKSQRLYADYTLKDQNIRQMKIYNGFYIFQTFSELIFYKFGQGQTPDFKYALPFEDFEVNDFEFNSMKSLYIASNTAITLFKLSGANKLNIAKITKFTSYQTETGNMHSISKLRTITTCDQVGFIAQGSDILIFEETLSLHDMKYLPIVKTISTGAPILEIKKVGRSLVVLTTERLIEYIFIEDCLNLTRNLVVSMEKLGVNYAVSVERDRNSFEIQGDPDSSYFMLVNKDANTLFIFQSGFIPDVLPNPFLHAYSDPYNRIFSANIIEKYDDSNQVELIVTMNQINGPSRVSFKKNPTWLVCDSFIPKNVACQIELEMRFCNTEMFNYTAISQESVIANNIENIQENKIYYNPNIMCKRTLQLDLAFKWSSMFLILCVVSVLLFILSAIVLICLYKKRAKKLDLSQKNQQPSNLKHFKFQNDDKSDVSDIMGAEDSTDRPVRLVHHTKNNNKTWKRFAKNYNLSVKVPRQLEGDKFIP